MLVTVSKTLLLGDHSKPRAKLNFAKKYLDCFKNILQTIYST